MGTLSSKLKRLLNQLHHPNTEEGKPMSTNPVVVDVEKGITEVKVIVTKVSTFVGKLFQKEEKLAPAAVASITSTVTALENFLAAAQPAVSGAGLNFPADSVAYAAFETLLTQFQADAAVIKAAV